MGALAFVAVCASFVVVSDTATAAPARTVEDVYAAAERSLTRPGHVFHVVMTSRGGSRDASRAEWWVDAGDDVVREQVTAGSSTTHTSLIADGNFYAAPGVTGEASTCFGASASVSAVLACPGPLEHSSTTVTKGHLDGRSVTVLTTTGSRSGEDSNTSFTRHLYLDATSSLPVAADEKGTVDTGTTRRYRVQTSYRSGFVRAATLPTDFFDPAAQGFATPGSTDLLRTIAPGTTLYWLGATFTPGAGLARSTLSRVEAGSPPGSVPRYAAILYYALASKPSGVPSLSIQVWARASWEDPRLHFDFTPCPDAAPITLDGGGTATINCSAGGGDPVAVVTYPDTVLVVGFTFNGSADETSAPYASMDAINIVLRELERTTT